ncbi:glucose-6-phosphate dehydrogenase [Nakamurella deserti]|uniref:glucose-6-phosphate dehydrogenase n=1 Tax=Nakamurella deserti TaxID=2164074 RepID=UPI000DBE3FD7|nr:glucose-6-phosphate dehydrogenase [Nakamurella deserti]
MADAIGTLLIFGASGDLTNRLLLPALGQLLSSSEGPHTLTVVGSGTEQWDDDTWRERVRAAFASVDATGPRVDAVLAGTRYAAADVTDADDLRRLLALCDGPPAIYFALPPAVTARSCAALRDLDLPEGTSLVLEKPFGTDERSAHALNDLLTAVVPESRIHRVDHFLAKTTVLNILGLRFANRIFEPLWSADHIERVDIVFDEPLALEDRARYYDGAGALVDMIQSHLLQVMAVVAMDPPLSIDARDLRDRKEEVMRSTRIWGGDPVKASRRARYTAGTIDGRDLPAYVDEPGVDPARDTETLAEITLEIDSWRWPGVPFRLRSGKALADKRKEIIISFKPVPRRIPGLYGTAVPAQLVISLGPEKISLDINVNGPDEPFELDREHLVAEFNAGRLPAYGEVLDAVFRGDPTLSVRGDTAEECWRIVDPVLAAWKAGDVPIDEYAAGSTGPDTWNDPSVGVPVTTTAPATPGS